MGKRLFNRKAKCGSSFCAHTYKKTKQEVLKGF